MWYLGLDVGGTHIDITAVHTDGARSEVHHVLPAHKLPEHVASQLVDEFVHDASINRKDIATVAIGWKHGRNRERSLVMIKNFAHYKLKAEVFWDAETAFIGALPDRLGLVVCCGTGAVVYGHSPRGKIICSGGWSPLLGDPGSAFSIGQKALVSALKSVDKSGPDTKLGVRVPQVLHMSLDETVVFADAHMDSAVPLLASLSLLVFELAESGDLEAVRIRDSAARAISERIASVIKVWPGGDDLVISYSGRLMWAQVKYRQMIQTNLRHLGINMTWREPQFRPPFGAILACYPKMYDTLVKNDHSLDWHH